MEGEPSFPVTFPGGVEFEATRDNTTIFRHIGRFALYDHIFFVRDEPRGQGTYLFNVHPNYNEVADYMMENEYPAHINLRQAADCDIEAFHAMIHKEATRDFEGGIPDDWF